MYMLENKVISKPTMFTEVTIFMFPFTHELFLCNLNIPPAPPSPSYYTFNPIIRIPFYGQCIVR
jgi:hypothetical protein